MFRYIKALWYMVTGRFSAAAEALQSNKFVMSATYDASIQKGADRFNTVKNAVAELMAIEQTRIAEIKGLKNTELHIATDDGSRGYKGYNTKVLEKLLEESKHASSAGAAACHAERSPKGVDEAWVMKQYREWNPDARSLLRHLYPLHP